MKKLLLSAGAVLLVACASQQPAPGTQPGDMSAEEHRAEEEKHDSVAAEHEDKASRPSRASGAHERQADEHSDVADQHGAAAETAEDED